MIPKLDVHNLTFSYIQRPVLQQVGFSVDQGKLLSLLGPNGSGKSTLLRCITKLLVPQKGRISVDGQDIRRMSRLKTAKIITYVPQSIHRVFPHTVYDVVFMGRRPHLGWVGGDRDREKAWQVLELLGLTDMAMQLFTQLSGGQQQKVLIARAMAQDTGLILLDEPTSNLDIWHQMDVLSIVRRLVKENGTTVVMAHHDLNLAAKYSDEILMMRNGKVTATGTPREVLTKANIAEVYHVDVHVNTEPDMRFVVPLRRRSIPPN
jgi:iron complex transport system ATP-binding protein